MAPRKRSTRKRGLPDNLYESRGYYSFKNPLTGDWFGLGSDRISAVAQAVEANVHLTGLAKNDRLIDRIQGTAGRTVQAWKEHYDTLLAKRHLALNTRRQYSSLGTTMVALFKPDTQLRALTPLDISGRLREVEANSPQAAKQLKSFLKKSFATAVVEGWIEKNPVHDVDLERVVVKRSRLSWEVFVQIRNASDAKWFTNAMELSLVSGQARAEIAGAQFKAVRDGFWFVERGKTKARICIPLDLQLDKLGKSLADVIRQCRQTGVASPYLIHQTEDRRRFGKKVSLTAVSCKFAEILKTLNLEFGDKDPPTFHEIRSLAARLYKQQGNVNRQELLAHKHEKTTKVYEDPRGEWLIVGAAEVATV